MIRLFATARTHSTCLLNLICTQIYRIHIRIRTHIHIHTHIHFNYTLERCVHMDSHLSLSLSLFFSRPFIHSLEKYTYVHSRVHRILQRRFAHWTTTRRRTTYWNLAKFPLARIIGLDGELTVDGVLALARYSPSLMSHRADITAMLLRRHNDFVIHDKMCDICIYVRYVHTVCNKLYRH